MNSRVYGTYLIHKNDFMERKCITIKVNCNTLCWTQWQRSVHMSEYEQLLKVINFPLSKYRHLFFVLKLISFNLKMQSWNRREIEGVLSFAWCTMLTIFHRMDKSLNSEITITSLSNIYRFLISLFFYSLTSNEFTLFFS